MSQNYVWPAVSVTIPPGGATAALQIVGNSSLSSIDGKIPSGLTVSSSRLLVDGSGVTQPISALSLPLPTGAATEATLSALSGKVPAGLTVTSTRLLVDGSGTTQPVSGTVTANAGTGTFAVSAVALPLPSGASTSALQITGNTSLSSIDGKIPTNLTVTSTRLLVDGSGVTQPVSGPLTDTQLRAAPVPVSNASLPLPAGAATSALQTTGNTSLASIDGKLPASLTVTATRLLVDGSGVTQPVSGPLTDTQLRASPVPVSNASLPLPTGASTSALQTTGNTSLASIDSKLTNGAQTTALLAGSALVGSVKVTDGTNTAVINSNGSVTVAGVSPVGVAPVNPPVGVSGVDGGGLKRHLLTATDGTLKVDGSASTQPVSGPLTDTQLRASAVPVSLASTTITGSVAVTGPLTDTQLRASAVPVSNASLPLPAGASTSANQVTAQTSLSSIDSKTPALGQAAMAASQPVVIASNQSTIPTSVGGKLKVNLARNDYSSVNVTTGAYVQLIASTGAASNLTEVFDSSGQSLVLAVGAAASEVDQFYINPGGNGQVPILIPAGSRVSIKAVTASATGGYINLTLYS